METCIIHSMIETRRLKTFGTFLNTLCFSLLNLYFDFRINLLFFHEFLWCFLILPTSTLLFFLVGLFYSQVELTMFVIFKSKFSFYDIHVLYLLLFYLRRYCLLNRYMFLLSMQQDFSLFSNQIHLSLIQLLFYFFL